MEKNKLIFFSGITLMASGMLAIYLDTAPHGFGWPTLWLAPVLLVSGWMMLLFAITYFRKTIGKLKNKKYWTSPTHIAGIVVFVAAMLLYAFTLPPTASLWDCSEYIAAAFRLQIPHAPGNPLFLLFGRLCAMWFEATPEHAALAINYMSAFFSALTIVLIFNILMLMFRNIQPQRNYWRHLILSATSALLFAATDTFWYSAVEAEIYAMATFFITLQLWWALRYFFLPSKDTLAENLIIQAWITGGAAAVHPMALLAIPPCVMLIYLKNKKWQLKHILISMVIGMLALALINHFLLTGWLEVAYLLDRWLVNTLDFPIWSGVWSTAALACLLLLISQKINPSSRFHINKNVIKIMAYLYVGLAFYWIIPLRSAKKPPINTGNPEYPSSFVFYLNRESYGSRPLLYGPYFDAKATGVKDKETMYEVQNGKYVAKGQSTTYAYDKTRQTILPRMYSEQPEHIQIYREQTGLKPDEKPTFRHNLLYLFKYQLGHMYFRYLMWNFSGRESDHQHDSWWAPWNNKNDVSENIQQNKAHNNYWMLPFLLGVLGSIWLFKHQRPLFIFILFILFLMGPALVLYLNAPPVEARERDYIYVGSFLAFTLTIPFGIIQLQTWLPKIRSIALFTLPILALWMVKENLNDHNRSGRVLQVEYARAQLKSCTPNAILFTGGDNDTFPLWYVQEVEHIRPDVRVIVLSYFNTDWYIDQLAHTSEEAEGIPISLQHQQYRQYGKNDYLPVIKNKAVNAPIHLEKFLNLIRKDHPALQQTFFSGNTLNTVPYPSFIWEKNGSEHLINLKNNYLEKSALILLDILTSNSDERPVYFNSTSLNTIGIDIKKLVAKQGTLYRLAPGQSNTQSVKKSVDLLLQMKLTPVDDHVYYNYEDHYLRIIQNIRNIYYETAINALNLGWNEQAKTLLEKTESIFPPDICTPGIQDAFALPIFIDANMLQTGDKLADSLFKATAPELKKVRNTDSYELRTSLIIMQHLSDYYQKRHLNHKAEECQQFLKPYI